MVNDFHVFQCIRENEGAVVTGIVDPKRFETLDERLIPPHHTNLENGGGMD
jgi:hypothetical protein